MSESDQLAELYQASVASLAREMRAARDEIANIHRSIQDMRSSTTRAAPYAALDRSEARLEEKIVSVQAQVEKIDARVVVVERQTAEAIAADRANAAAVASFQRTLRLFIVAMAIVASLIALLIMRGAVLP